MTRARVEKSFHAFKKGNFKEMSNNGSTDTENGSTDTVNISRGHRGHRAWNV